MRFLLALLLAARLFAASDVLVQGAIEPELKPLLAALGNAKETRVGAWTFWSGTIGRKSVVVSRTDVGPINAAAATALGIQTFQPTVVINQGTAGAQNPDLNLWDIVVGEQTTDYGAFVSAHGDEGSGMDPRRWKPMAHRLRLGDRLVEFPSFPGDKRLIDAALSVPYRRGKLVRGNIGSAFEYNRELDRMKWLRKNYGIDTEDMESAFAAGVATAMQVSFVAIRIVSDSEWKHPTFERVAGEYCAQFTVELIRALR
jgi:adenosylhomocysteine nucleosidase